MRGPESVVVVVRLMVDSDSIDALRDPVFRECAVATYADLLTPAIVEEFAGRLLVIDRGLGDPLNRAHIADIEDRALTVESGAARIREWNARGLRWITAYVNRSNWPAVRAACAPIVPRFWVATLDGTMTVGDPEPAAIQFAGESSIGRHVDVSVIYDPSFAVIGASSNSGAVHAVQNAALELSSVVGTLAKAAMEL